MKKFKQWYVRQYYLLFRRRECVRFDLHCELQWGEVFCDPSGGLGIYIGKGWFVSLELDKPKKSLLSKFLAYVRTKLLDRPKKENPGPLK